MVVLAPDGHRTSAGRAGGFAPNDQIRATLNQLRIGHIIKLQGQLLHVKAPDGWRWRSSLSRTDTGVHSCELVWVEQLSIEPIQTKTPSH